MQQNLNPFFLFFFPQVVYEQEGVFIHSSSGNDDQDSLLSGILRVIEKVFKSNLQCLLCT